MTTTMDSGDVDPQEFLRLTWISNPDLISTSDGMFSKLKAIREVRIATGLGLKESKTEVEKFIVGQKPDESKEPDRMDFVVERPNNLSDTIIASRFEVMEKTRALTFWDHNDRVILVIAPDYWVSVVPIWDSIR